MYWYVDALKNARVEVYSRSTYLFPRSMHQERLPESKCNAVMILMHNKEDHKEIRSDRPNNYYQKDAIFSLRSSLTYLSEIEENEPQKCRQG